MALISAKTKTATRQVERMSMDVLGSNFGFEIQSGLITVLSKWMRKQRTAIMVFKYSTKTYKANNPCLYSN
jgi:hypothetical protein